MKMQTRAGAVLLVALVLVGFSPLAAQQQATQQQATEPLVMLATNLTAAADSAAGTARADSIRGMVFPDDVVEYRLVFTNPRNDVVRNIVLENAVPTGLFYVANSASGSRPDVQVEFSIDGGASWSARPEIEVEVDGQTVRQPAPPEMYTNLRFTVTGDVAAGEQVEARYRTRMPGAEAPTGSAAGQTQG
jgi:uncharacterized repeat protein (TIGR01451 family)